MGGSRKANRRQSGVVRYLTRRQVDSPFSCPPVVSRAPAGRPAKKRPGQKPSSRRAEFRGSRRKNAGKRRKNPQSPKPTAQNPESRAQSPKPTNPRNPPPLGSCPPAKARRQARVISGCTGLGQGFSSGLFLLVSRQVSPCSSLLAQQPRIRGIFGGKPSVAGVCWVNVWGPILEGAASDPPATPNEFSGSPLASLAQPHPAFGLPWAFLRGALPAARGRPQLPAFWAGIHLPESAAVGSGISASPPPPRFRTAFAWLLEPGGKPRKAEGPRRT